MSRFTLAFLVFVLASAIAGCQTESLTLQPPVRVEIDNEPTVTFGEEVSAARADELIILTARATWGQPEYCSLDGCTEALLTLALTEETLRAHIGETLIIEGQGPPGGTVGFDAGPNNQAPLVDATLKAISMEVKWTGAWAASGSLTVTRADAERFVADLEVQAETDTGETVLITAVYDVAVTNGTL